MSPRTVLVCVECGGASNCHHLPVQAAALSAGTDRYVKALISAVGRLATGPRSNARSITGKDWVTQ